MALPAEVLTQAQGLIQPLRLTEGITRGELARVLNGAANEAYSLMQFNLTRTGVTGAVTAARMEAAMRGLGSLNASMWGQIGSLVQQGVYQASDLAVNQQIDRDFLSGMPFNAIRQYEQGMFFNAYQSAEDILSRRTNGFTLAERIYRNGRASVLQAGREVERGLALQQSAREIAGRVRSLYRPDVPGGPSYAAMRLARTEINNAHHDTTIRLSKDQPWVTGYKWHLSSRHPKPDPCDQYAHHNEGLGEGVFATDSVPSKPHPQCLCFIEVVQDDDEVFMNKLTSGQYDQRMREMGVHCR